MSTPSKDHVDGVLMVWGERYDWSPRFRKPRKPRNARGSMVRAASTGALSQSPATVRATLRAFARRSPQVMVKISGGGKAMGAIRAHMAYIARQGNLAVEDEQGQTYRGKDELKDLAETWQYAGEPVPEEGRYRESINIVLSMPAGTPPEAVRDAARDFAVEEFGDNHQYVMVLHEEGSDPASKAAKHPHVHLTVKARGFDGKRLNPRKADLRAWRERFAHYLRVRGIDAQATPRKMRLKRAKGSPYAAHAMKKHRDQEPRSAPGGRNETAKAKAEKNMKEMLGGYHDVAKVLASSPDVEDRKLALALIERLRDLAPGQGRGVEQNREIDRRGPSR